MKTADLCDQCLDELQVCELPFQSYGGKRMFFGPIATVDVFEDNVLVREALETVPPGTVLVVDGKGSRRVALLGDRLAQIACDRGLPASSSTAASAIRRKSAACRLGSWRSAHAR
ncbi:putative regulator of ribonuclease activity [Geobacillus sp. BCO2]|nr:putative regulator of ribonuclease activity [Geobacillus sp. BCO2]